MLKSRVVSRALWPLLFSCSVMSDSLRPHGLQHARLPCPSLSLGVCWNSCPLGQWWHPTISSFVTPSPPALNLSQQQCLFHWVTSGGMWSIHSIDHWMGCIQWSFSFSPSNKYSGLISYKIDWFDLAVQGTVKSLLQHH